MSNAGSRSRSLLALDARGDAARRSSSTVQRDRRGLPRHGAARSRTGGSSSRSSGSGRATPIAVRTRDAAPGRDLGPRRGHLRRLRPRRRDCGSIWTGVAAEAEVVRDHLTKDVEAAGRRARLRRAVPLDRGLKGGRLDDLQLFEPGADAARGRPPVRREGADRGAREPGRRGAPRPTISPPWTPRWQRRGPNCQEAAGSSSRPRRASSRSWPWRRCRSPGRRTSSPAASYDAPEGHSRVGRVAPARPAPLPGRRRARPARPGAVADRPEAPADRPRGGQPLLAVVLRPGARRDGRELRPAGGAAVAPGAARLAGARLRRHRAGT